MFELPALPFDPAAFGAFTSAETFSYHHGKHHAGYVTKLNAAIEGTSYAGQSLEEVITASRAAGDKAVFNNAAQHFNHSFFWTCLSSDATEPSSELRAALEQAFGSVEAFKEQFTQAATALFGSGWTWLVQRADGTLGIETTKDAETPLGTGSRPLLTLDVWEHAYYLDHKNNRAGFGEAFWKYVNWNTPSGQLQ